MQICQGVIRSGSLDMTAETVAHNLGIAAEMQRVVRALNSAHISNIVLKGIPLCERIGEGLDRRAIADNDILVHRKDVPRAMEALEQLGYRSLSWRSVDRDLEEGFEHPLSRPDVDGRPLFCELHWNVFPPSLFRVNESTLWTRSVSVDVLGAPIRVFEPALQLLHLASHAVQHELCEPRTLEVFGRAWSRWNREVDAAELERLADEVGIGTVLEYVVEMARELGFVDGSSTLLPSRRVALAKRLLAPRRLLEPAEDRYPERYLRASIVLMLVPPVRALKHLVARVVPPPEKLVRQRGAGAIALHYVSRPWRPIARSAGSIARIRRALAVNEYLRIHRSLARRYSEAALDALLRDLESAPRTLYPLPIPEVARAIRVAERLAPGVSRTPNTCLFRALTRYAVLASHAHPARFVLGVASRPNDPGHAWVEIENQPFLETVTPSAFNRILARDLESPLAPAK